ncbi:MAG: hypothetical protein AAFY15_01960 [Cyanobacteria bacterium J06648_11]
MELLRNKKLLARMSSTLQAETDRQPEQATATSEAAPAGEPVLCVHCKRTATNGIKCRGFCVADSDY